MTPSVEDLLLEWEEARERGEAPTPEVLCRDCPELTDELRKRIAALGDFAPLMESKTVKNDQPPAVKAPFAVPGYAILGILGEGGMGVVYRARQEKLNRLVALKTISAGAGAASSERQRFQIEAEASARLQHPNIVQVFEVGEHDGCCFLTLELVEGGSLSRRLARRPQPPLEAARLMETLARAVHHAHQRGILHRDLKPGNILLRSLNGEAKSDETFRAAQFEVKIADFGLAKRLDVDQGQTRTGYILGTPSYMAPEQAEGRNAEVGTSADVYALGAILYECLTGRPPFCAATTTETLRQVAMEEPTPPSTLQRGMPRDIETLCLKCLEKDPTKRYASANDLADDLHRFTVGEPILARPVSWLERWTRWARRHPARAAAGLLAVLLIVGLVAGSIGFAVLQRNHATELGNSLDAEKKSRLDAESRLAESYRDRGLAACEAGEANVGLLWLARAFQTAPPEAETLTTSIRANLAGWKTRAVRPDVIAVHDDWVRAVAVSADGKHFAIGSHDGMARIWHFDEKPVGPPITHGGKVLAVAFHPDGKSFVTAGEAADGGGEAKLWEVGTSRPLGAIGKHAKPIQAIAFSSDGSRIVTGSDDKTACVWNVDGTPVNSPLSHAGPVTAVAFGADDSVITWSQRSLKRWSTTKGKSSARAIVSLPPGRAISASAIASDGHTLVVGADDGQARFWNATDGAPGEPFRHTRAVSAAAFSPDGRVAATGGIDRIVRIREVATGRAIGPSLEHPDTVLAIAIAPDGRTLVTGCRDGRARVWRVPAINPPGTVTLEHDAIVSGAAFNSSGHLLATRSVDKTVRVWDAVAGKPKFAPFRHETSVYGMTWSSEGDRLAVAGDKQVTVWDLSGEPKSRRLDHPSTVMWLAFMKDGERLRSADLDGTVRTWNSLTGQMLATEDRLPIAENWPLVAFRPDGHVILATTKWTERVKRGEARLFGWDGQPFGPVMVHEGRITALAMSPDERICATGGEDRATRLWNAITGESLAAPLPQAGVVEIVAFSPDGSKVAVGCQAGQVQVWNTSNGQPFGAALVHDRSIASLKFSPDGKLLLTGTNGGEARLWDLASGRPIGPAMINDGSVTIADFRADGSIVAIGGRNKKVHLCPLPSAFRSDRNDVATWAELLTGMELLPNGAVRSRDK